MVINIKMADGAEFLCCLEVCCVFCTPTSHEKANYDRDSDDCCYLCYYGDPQCYALCCPCLCCCCRDKKKKTVKSDDPETGPSYQRME